MFQEDYDREKEAREAAVKVKLLAEERMKRMDKELRECQERVNDHAVKMAPVRTAGLLVRRLLYDMLLFLLLLLLLLLTLASMMILGWTTSHHSIHLTPLLSTTRILD